MTLPKEKRQVLRNEFYETLRSDGSMELRTAVKKLRKFMGKTQMEYAQMIGISPRVLIDFERGIGNPTLASIQAMIGSLGLELCVRDPK